MASCQSHAAALYLNNAGVALLQRGCVSQALSVFENAIRLLNDAAGGSSFHRTEELVGQANQAVALAQQSPLSSKVQVVSLEELFLTTTTKGCVVFRVDTTSQDSDMTLETAMILFNFSSALQLYKRCKQSYLILKLAHYVLRKSKMGNDYCTNDCILCLMRRILINLMGLAQLLCCQDEQVHFYQELLRLPAIFEWMACNMRLHAGAA